MMFYMCIIRSLIVIYRIMIGKLMIFDWLIVIDFNDFIGWVWGVSV